jgi:hypothetical protein
VVQLSIILEITPFTLNFRNTMIWNKKMKQKIKHWFACCVNQ